MKNKASRSLIVLATISAVLLVPSAQAKFLWAKRIASAAGAGDNKIIGMATDNFTNLYVTGWFDGTNDFGGVTLTNGSNAGEGIFVVKYSRSGVAQWVEQVSGGPGVDSEENAGRDVGVDAAGNVYLTGELFCPASFGTTNVTAASSGSCFFLAKYNSNGVVQWVRLNACPPSNFCAGDGLAVDGAGNSYVVGSFDGNTIVFGATTLTNASLGNPNRFLVKYDTYGVVQWDLGILSTDQSMANGVSVDTNGNVYVTGRFLSNLTIGKTNFTGSGAWNGFVAKISHSGDVQWAKQITSASGVQPFGARADNLGSVYIVGGFGTVAGTTASFGSSITLTNQGGGSAGSNEGDGMGDAFVAKYDAATGAVQWARRAGGTNTDDYLGVSTDSNGSVYVGGGIGGTGVPAGFNAVAAKYSPNGVLEWALPSLGTGGALIMAGPQVDANGNGYAAGWYQGTATFGTNVLQPQGTWNLFLAKVAPPTPPTLGIALTNGLPQLSITGDIGSLFSLQRSPFLSATNTPWQTMTTLTLTNRLQVYLDTGAPSGTNRFYRAGPPAL